MMINNLIPTFEAIGTDIAMSPNTDGDIDFERAYINQAPSDGINTFSTPYYAAETLSGSILPSGRYTVEAMITGTVFNTDGASIGIDMTLDGRNSSNTSYMFGGQVSLNENGLVRVKTQAALNTAANANELSKPGNLNFASVSLNSTTGYAAYAYATFRSNLRINISTGLYKFRLSFQGFSQFSTIYFRIKKISDTL